MSEISKIFARYALTKTDLPSEAVHAAKTFMLDSFGVGIAGSKAPFSDAVLNTVLGWGALGTGARVWGRGITLPPPSAAFMNGFQIHGMEFDCVHEPAVVHPMATIFAALCAEAEVSGASGKALIDAVIIAVDIAIELGAASHSALKFFRPATAGLFGATLGIARLRNFDEQTALSAMGCALSQCAGVMQGHVEGKPVLPLQIAGAARAAVMACDLAQAGLEGPKSSLEGPYGYFAMFEDVSDPAAAAARLGEVHRITQVSWKPFPTGRAAQGGIVLMQKLRAKGVRLDNLERLTLSAPPIIPRLVGRPMTADMSPNYARLCFAYLAQIALERGTVGLGDFSQADLRRADFLSLASHIHVEENGTQDPAAFTPQTATAVLRGGETIRASITALLGSPADPLTPNQHLEKFRACIEFGLSEVKAQRAADGLIAAMENLERQPNCISLFDLASGI